MLLEKAGQLTLSEDSELRLNSFVRKFCIEKAANGYDLGPLIYACHAAFPIVLSPRLANLIWLNFGVYKDRSGPKKIEPVAVSDLLLSPIIRQTTSQQFEMVPEIRTYLLYLLKDGSWLSNRGIQRYQGDRLYALAKFTSQYLNEDKSLTGADQKNFRQSNQWAALAYLDPKQLSLDMARAFESSFNGEKQNPSGEQLRLNLFMDRFSKQISLNLHKGSTAGAKAFANLHLYSTANKARLFGKAAQQVSDLYQKLEKTYISDKKIAINVELPVPDDFSSRLLRKKQGIKKLHSVFISTENPLSQTGDSGIRAFNALIEQLEKRKDLSLDAPYILNNGTSLSALRTALEDLYSNCREEDEVMIYYYCDLPATENNEIMLQAENQYELTSVNKDEFKSLLSKAKQGKNIQSTIILNIPLKKADSFVPDTDVQISFIRKELYHERNYNSIPTAMDFSENFLQSLKLSDNNLCIKDVAILMDALSRRDSDSSSKTVIYYPKNRQNTIILSNNNKRYWLKDPLVLFNHERQQWKILEDEFQSLPIGEPLSIFAYNSYERFTEAIRLISDEGGAYLNWTDERMARDEIYVARLERTLYYAVDPSLEQSLDADGFFWKISSESRNPWTSFKINSYRSKNQDIYPHIYIQKAANSPRAYDITLTKKPTEGERPHKIELKDISQKELKNAIIKFHALVNLDELSNRNHTLYYSDRFRTNFKWAHQTEDDFGTSQLEISAQSLMIKNGELIIQPLLLEIIADMSCKSFIDVYLSLPDLSIKKISGGSVDMHPGEVFRLPLELNISIIDFLQKNQHVFLKVLIGNSPINLDFSQNGIKS
jgi:hypothetical protein